MSKKSDTAYQLAHKHHIDLEQDFHQLSPSEVSRVLDAADEYGYRKPKSANGSRGRYFFALLQRSASRAKR